MKIYRTSLSSKDFDLIFTEPRQIEISFVFFHSFSIFSTLMELAPVFCCCCIFFTENFFFRNVGPFATAGQHCRHHSVQHATPGVGPGTDAGAGRGDAAVAASAHPSLRPLRPRRPLRPLRHLRPSRPPSSSAERDGEELPSFFLQF